jgi:predicted DNA-binding transcriptional regulator AlpA
MGYMDTVPRYDTRHVVGAHEIAEMLGISRQRVNQMARERGFPKPFGRLRMGDVWRRNVIEQWARDNGRTLSEPTP